MGVRFDVVTFGECMLRCSPLSGEMLEQADRLRIDPAGTESNMAVALARLGMQVSWISALPDSPVGRWISRQLEAQGVDVSHVFWTKNRVGVFFLETGSPPRGSRVLYDRAHSAISFLTPGMMDWNMFDGARLVHTTGITVALSQTCRALVSQAMQEARARGCRTSFDINYRARLWPPALAASTLAPVLEKVDVLISTEADIRLLFNLEGDPQALIEQLHTQFKNSIIVLTLAEGGAVGWSEPTGWVSATAHPVEQVDRLGAGDAFDAGLLYGLLHDDLSSGLRCGAALAALSYSEQGDITWSTLEEMVQLAGYTPAMPLSGRA